MYKQADILHEVSATLSSLGYAILSQPTFLDLWKTTFKIVSLLKDSAFGNFIICTTIMLKFEQKIDWIVNWKNRKRYFQNIGMLREIGVSRFLEKSENIGAHMEALMTPYGSPERKYLKKWNP